MAVKSSGISTRFHEIQWRRPVAAAVLVIVAPALFPRLHPPPTTLYSITCGGGIAKWLRRRSANRTAPIFNELSAARRKHGRCKEMLIAPRG
jgi:hypothetical protein